VHHDVDRAAFQRDLLRWLRERSMRAHGSSPDPAARS
jgi:hypothetical protein